MKQIFRIGFVVPRYGENILGGAETLVRGLAEQLIAAEICQAEVLTTCARDHFTWKNELPPGRSTLNGVPVWRFPIDSTNRSLARYEALHIRLIRREMLSVSEQYEWLDQSAHSPAMYDYLEKCGRDFDFLIFVPYLFGTTFYGSAIFPERSILWPCLHNEIYAYLQPIREMFHSVRGIMFNTLPEAHLAERLYGKHPGGKVVGFGFSTLAGDASRLRRQSPELRDPFILYSGRLEGAKNVPLLRQYFSRYKAHHRNSLKLVLMGEGPDLGTAHPDIIRIGFKQGQDKLDVYAAALALCQPSINESFSIVLMESWLCRAPVIVHSDCAVTRYNVVQSNGGLYFRDYDEFEAVIDLLVNEPAVREKLADHGKTYVTTNYNWEAVLDRFQSTLRHWSMLGGAGK